MGTRVTTGSGIVVPKATERRGVSEYGFQPMKPEQLRWCFVGRVGSGKTVFCNSVPNACIFDFENKSQFVARRAKGTETFFLPRWTDYLDKVDELVSDRAGGSRFGFKTVIFDVFESLIDTMQSDLTELFDAKSKLDNLPIADITKMGDKGSGWEVIYKQFSGMLNRLVRAGFGVGFTGHMQPVYSTNQKTGETSVSWKYVAPPKSVSIVTRMCDFSGFIERRVETEKVEVEKAVYRNGKKVMGKGTEVVEKGTYYLCIAPPDPRMESRQPVPMLNEEIELPLCRGWETFVAEYEASCKAYAESLKGQF